MSEAHCVLSQKDLIGRFGVIFRETRAQL